MSLYFKMIILLSLDLVLTLSFLTWKVLLRWSRRMNCRGGCQKQPPRHYSEVAMLARLQVVPCVWSPGVHILHKELVKSHPSWDGLVDSWRIVGWLYVFEDVLADWDKRSYLRFNEVSGHVIEVSVSRTYRWLRLCRKRWDLSLVYSCRQPRLRHWLIEL